MNSKTIKTTEIETGSGTCPLTLQLPPLGLILCTEGSEEQIKYLEMDKTGIRVAHYYTELPKPEELQEIIQRQIQFSKQNAPQLTE